VLVPFLLLGGSMHIRRFSLLLAVVVLSPTSALAQGTGTSPAPAAPGAPPAAVERPVRDGVLFGFGIGGGQMSCESQGDTCNGVTEAGGIDLHVGYMLRPRLGIVGEIWPMYHTENLVTITHVITTVGVQWFAAPRLWLRAGVGNATAHFRYAGVLVNASTQTENVPAVMGAVGYEVMAGQRFAMDIQLRAGTGFYDDGDAKAHNVGAELGFTWY